VRAALLLALLLWARMAAADPEVALFDPDANLANVSALRSAVGSFLRTIDDGAHFQPFGKVGDLKRHLEQAPVQFVLLNTLYVGELGKLKLTAAVIPLRGGAATYHKVLLVRRGTDPRAIKIVATTSPPVEVTGLVAGGRTFEDALVLRVSKGIDALLGMALGRVDAAYVTPETVQALTSVDPELAASLVEIFRSPAIPNPPLYVVGDVPPALVKRVVAAFLAMDATPEGRAVLRTLNYTGWRTP
jgi:hypothetical protein